MRPARRRLLTAALLITLVPACAEQASAPTDPSAPELATRTSHGNVREEFSLPDVDNPCTPQVEAIDLEGIIHGQSSVWDNDHFKSHYDVNLTGVDADGVRYQGTSTGNGKGEFIGSETEDVVISTVLNNNGGKPQFVSKLVLHHHKDGSVTVDKASEECRG